jgi:uncharacterized iron-regulated membrane protein
MKVRQIAFKLHRYVGMMVGIILTIVGLTGSFLVFGHEIDHLRNLPLMEVVPQGDRVSIDSILEPVKKAYPNLKLSSIDLPRKPEETYKVGMASPDDKWIDVYVHPYTGAILGKRQWGQTLMTFIYDIHMTLLAGEIGEMVVGFCGILLLILGVTGLILWPGWKKLTPGFKIRWNSPARLLNYDIHKVGGIFSAVFLVAIAFSGAAIIFHEQFEPAVYWLTGTPKPAEVKSTIIANSPPSSLETVLQKANAALPGGEITFIALPKKPDGVFRVTKKLAGEAHPSGRNRIYLDQYSAKVLRVDNALVAPIATKIMNVLFPLHIGAYGGLVMRIIYVFVGLAPMVLFITGFVLWRQRQWAIARRQEAIRQSQGLPAPDREILVTTAWPWI